MQNELYTDTCVRLGCRTTIVVVQAYRDRGLSTDSGRLYLPHDDSMWAGSRFMSLQVLYRILNRCRLVGYPFKTHQLVQQ